MDLTLSNAYTTDVATGNRMHQASAAVTTAVSDQDMNGLIWELVSLIKAGGLVPAAFDKTNAATYTQVAMAIQSGKLFSAASGGTADAITATFNPGITALKDGMALYVRAAVANATAIPTFTPASGTIAAKAIVKGAGAALSAGDIAGAGHWIELQYDLTLDRWVLLNPANGVVVQAAGAVSMFAQIASPFGWVKANGAAVSRTAYAALFAAIGTTYGVGDGSTTFNLPDLRGEFLRGYDDGRGVDTGRGIGTAQVATSIGGYVHSDSASAGALAAITVMNTGGETGPTVGGPNATYFMGASSAANGGSTYSGSFAVRPRNVALLACIKY